jgi:diguanylate cyclase (GGDEF)-like protein
VLVVAADRQWSEPLLQEAASWDLRIEIAAELLAARACIEHDHPNLVLLDLAIAPTKAESLALLTELNQKLPPIPVLVLATENQLHDRLTVARLGGQAFLKKPLSAEQVLIEVNRILQHVKTTEARVMIVDDDPQILATLKTLLIPWGLKVTTLSDPTQFWEVLEAASPNLLILDIKMPQISGVELCRVVRNDPRWSELPILFLTAYIDAATVNQVFAAGADDFISKPIVGPELVTRIMNRLERTKLLKNLAELDPLTKVLNRQKSRQALDELLHRAEQHQQPLSLAVLDLNHLKQINHHYGDAVGDKVLRQLGQILRRSFRGDDVVGRWSGEEFVVGMYGMTKQEAEQRMTHLLEILQQESFSVLNSAAAQVTPSVGIAQYPDDGADLRSLYGAAVFA